MLTRLELICDFAKQSCVLVPACFHDQPQEHALPVHIIQPPLSTPTSQTLLYMSCCSRSTIHWAGPQTCFGYIAKSREAVDAERAVNKAIGDRTGCWKAGVLVEDDAGSVKQALSELARKAKSRQ